MPNPSSLIAQAVSATYTYAAGCVIGMLDERVVFAATAVVDDSKTAMESVKSGLTIASDAWHFKEGNAKLWERAR